MLCALHSRVHHTGRGCPYCAYIISSMIALTPSGPRKCSQIDPCFGSKSSANVKKGQHPRSKAMNCTSLFAQASLPGKRKAYPSANSFTCCTSLKSSLTSSLLVTCSDPVKVQASGTSSVKNSVSCSMSLNAFLSCDNLHSSGSVFQLPGTNRHVETVLHRSQGTYPTVVVSARRIVSVIEIEHDTFEILDARHG